MTPSLVYGVWFDLVRAPKHLPVPDLNMTIDGTPVVSIDVLVCFERLDTTVYVVGWYNYVLQSWYGPDHQELHPRYWCYIPPLEEA